MAVVVDKVCPVAIRCTARTATARAAGACMHASKHCELTSTSDARDTAGCMKCEMAGDDELTLAEELLRALGTIGDVAFRAQSPCSEDRLFRVSTI